MGAIVIVIETADAHAGAGVFNSGLGCDIGERAIAIVAVQVLAPEVIHYVKVGPAVAVEVSPAAAEAVAGVVAVETGLGGNVVESAVAAVAHQEVGRAVFRVVIRAGIPVLASTLIVDVEAEINVEPAIAVVVGGSRAGEGSLRRRSKLKRVRPLAKFAAALIKKQKRPIGAHHDQVLTAVVIEIGEDGACRILQYSNSRSFGDVLEG